MNMKSKALIMATFLAVSAPLCVHAGDKHDKDLIKSLNLQGDKADRVEDVVKSYHDQAEKIKDNAKDQLGDLRDQKDKEIKAILSDAEYKRYESLQDAKEPLVKSKNLA
jgi:hypothetical protein